MLRKIMLRSLLLSAVIGCGFINSTCQASERYPNEPGWTHGVLLFGEERDKKDATPILQREYRPFHFYGNTVRRQHYRGNVRPSVTDGLQAVRVTIVRD
jgi:hypothetical protein